MNKSMDLNQTLISLLVDIRERVQDDDREKIDAALDDAEADLITPSPHHITKTSAKRTHEKSFGEEKDGVNSQNCDSCLPASEGSINFNSFSEDLLRSRESKESGYKDQNSEIQWLRNFQQQTEGGVMDIHGQIYGMQASYRANTNNGNVSPNKRTKPTEHIPTTHTTDATFCLDSETIEVDTIVDPYEVPRPEVADYLIDCYMKTIHSSFPVLPVHFEKQLRKYITSIRNNRPFQIPDKWRAIMNLIFAIGAKFSNITSSYLDHEDCNHLVYMTRAVHLLELKSTVVVISGPDLGLVQATGLLSLYFLVIGHVSRAWLMIGMSLRFALALGLHLRNEDDSIDGAKRESMEDTWWSLQAIESLINSVTGRPPIILSENCTVATPRAAPPSNHEHLFNDIHVTRHHVQSAYLTAHPSHRPGANRTHYFAAHIRMTIITQRVLSNLYSPRSASHTWEDIQNKIKELLDELDAWATTAFPQELVKEPVIRQEEFEREQFLLRISYWSTRILITQPCICRGSRSLSEENDRVKSFITQASEICVDAAHQMTKLFPDQPNAEMIYSIGPWWTLIHNVMQSVAVLLLAFALNKQQRNSNGSDLIFCIKKSVDWLRSLQAHDPVAARAYQLIHKIMTTCAIPQAHEIFSQQHNSTRVLPLPDPAYSMEKPNPIHLQLPTLVQRSTVGYDAINPRLFEPQAMDFAYDNQPGVDPCF
ncbi:hypothetical protein IQ07DRAFT_630471 [Pyrenochaeta sp. DS3sAY3a]|nr:hypothetical protein IQ07DRAFT_630471 [Pyrenochaeta sp. DS3sAY3a]